MIVANEKHKSKRKKNLLFGVQNQLLDQTHPLNNLHKQTFQTPYSAETSMAIPHCSGATVQRIL